MTFNCKGYFKVEKSAFKGQYALSRIVSWFELVRDLFKQYVHRTICTFIKNLFKSTQIRRYASNHISIESKFFKNPWNKTQVRTYGKLIKTWKRQFGSNHIVPDTVFLRALTTQESYICSMKIDKIYLRGQYGSTYIVPGKTLAKVFETVDADLYIILVRTIRVKPYCPLIRMF